MRASAVGLALYVSVACTSRNALAADEPATHLDYTVDPSASECPPREALVDAVSKRMGRDPFAVAASRGMVVAISQRDQLVARLALVDEQGRPLGERTLREEVGHCDELIAALSLAISIALDPNAMSPASPEPSLSPAIEAKPLPATAPPPSAPEPPPSEVDDAKLRLGAHLAAFSSLGSAPELAAGAKLGISADYRQVRGIIEGARQFPAERGLGDGRAVRASLYEASLAGCLVHPIAAICALVQLAAYESEGKGAPRSTSDRSLFAAVGARLELRPRLIGPLHWLLDLDVSTPLTPITLRMQGQGLWSSPIAFVSAGTGVAVDFW